MYFEFYRIIFVSHWHLTSARQILSYKIQIFKNLSNKMSCRGSCNSDRRSSMMSLHSLGKFNVSWGVQTVGFEKMCWEFEYFCPRITETTTSINEQKNSRFQNPPQQHARWACPESWESERLSVGREKKEPGNWIRQQQAEDTTYMVRLALYTFVFRFRVCRIGCVLSLRSLWNKTKHF